MTHHLLYNFNDKLGPWVHQRIPWMGEYQPGRAQFVGVATGPGVNDRLLAVFFFHDYSPLVRDKPIPMFKGRDWGGVCMFGVAAVAQSGLGCRWATRDTIRRLLSIPFLEYKCRKLEASIPSTNERARRFAEGIGLRLEGTLRNHYAQGVHAGIFGMMRNEFDERWLAKRLPMQATNELPGQSVQHAVAAAGS